MGDNHLDRVLPFLKKIDKKRREQFCAYFKNAPLWLLDSFSIEKMEKGRIFIREGTPVEAIYFIGDGLIKATDYRRRRGLRCRWKIPPAIRWRS